MAAQAIVASTPKVLETVTKMGFSPFKNTDALYVAFTHKYIPENKPKTAPQNARLADIGEMSLSVAVRKYLYDMYPLLPPPAMEQASKWFSSDIALARYAKHLNLNDYLQFKDQSNIYDVLPREEKVSLLATTYKCLMGAARENVGLQTMETVVARQVEWVESLNITDSIEEEESPKLTKYAQEKKKVQELLAKGIPQPKLHKPPPNWLAHTLKVTAPTFPRQHLAELFTKSGLGTPLYQIIREVGRFTKDPIFLIGVFDHKANMVGQGLGSKESEAEELACRDALSNLLSKKAEITR